MRLNFFICSLFFLSSCASPQSSKKQPKVTYAEVESILSKGTFIAPAKRRYWGRSITLTSKVSLKGKGELNVLVKPTHGLVKKNENKNAQAAYELSKYIDLVDTPIHVIRQDALVSESKGDYGEAGVQVWIDDASKPNNSQFKTISDFADYKSEIEEMAVWDCLIGNNDRHDSNYLVLNNARKGERRLVAIDHSLTFPTSFRLGFPNPEAGAIDIIESFLKGEKKGAISEKNVNKLKSLKKNFDKVEKVLSKYLGPASIDAMEARLDNMVRLKKIFEP